MAAIITTEERVNVVHIEGLALLKIVKHCHESLPHMVTGSVLGLEAGNGVLEITHAFAVPTANTSSSSRSDNKHNDDGGGGGEAAAGLEGHEFQLEMMRMLREVNVDNNCVGWYQSMYLGIFSTSSLLENQVSYQTDLSPNSVVLLYDPMQTTNGKMVLKCLRVTEECMKLKSSGDNSFIDPKTIFEEVPIKLTNPGLVRALLADIVDGVHIDPATGENALCPGQTSLTFDRLDLSTNPYLEKHLEFMSSWVDDLAAEQQKFQYYARQLARGGSDRRDWKNKQQQQRGKRGGGEEEDSGEGWESSDAPRRLESLLITNQIRSYCEQMENFSGEGLNKLYLVAGLHKQGTTS